MIYKIPRWPKTCTYLNIINIITEPIAEKCKSDCRKLKNCFLNSIHRRRNKTSSQSAQSYNFMKIVAINRISSTFFWEPRVSILIHIQFYFIEYKINLIMSVSSKLFRTHRHIEVHNQDESSKYMPNMENTIFRRKKYVKKVNSS